jgi:CO/xanthine dehydrogenase Mo-binding subunit
MDFCSCILNGQYDGSLLLETGIHENGQGSESAMILILAEALGCDQKRIRYRRPSTSNVPDSGTTVATRGTIMGGSAVMAAVAEFKALLSTHLAERLRCKPEEVTFHDDKIWGLNYEYSLSWEEAMRELYLQRVTPYAFGSFKAPDVSWDDTNGQGDAYFTFVYSCQAVELSVDKKTGKVKLLNIVAAHDIGKAINRAMLLGQMYGGITQAVGMALMEDFRLEGGKPVARNFDGYTLPRSTDLPPMTGIIVENHDPASLTGAKGIGEPAIELLAPAIANAVYNATGIRAKEPAHQAQPGGPRMNKLTINGTDYEPNGRRTGHDPHALPAGETLPARHQERLRGGALRQLYGRGRRQAPALLPQQRGEEPGQVHHND